MRVEPIGYLIPPIKKTDKPNKIKTIKESNFQETLDILILRQKDEKDHRPKGR